MKFGGRAEIQLSGALQHYKQNHEVDMNVTGTKWIDFYYVLMIEATEFTQ